jgi:hypothetical protein
VLQHSHVRLYQALFGSHPSTAQRIGIAAAFEQQR